MTLLVPVLAQLLHLAVMVGAALLLEGLRSWLSGRLAGRAAPEVVEFVRDLRRGFAKRLVRTEGTAALAASAPVVALAASLAAASLVPSFTPGLAFAPLGDALVVAGLLMLARLAEAFLTGEAAANFAEPALLLAIFTAAVPAGGGAAWVLYSAAAVVAVVALLGANGTWPEGSGADFAVLTLARAVRRLVFLALLISLVLSPGVGGRGVEWWPVGLAVWCAGIVGLTVVLALAEVVLPAFSLRRRAEGVAASMVLAAAAVLVALGAGGAP